MDIIYTDKNFIEKGVLLNVSFDIEIGKYGTSENDFELTISTNVRDVNFDEGSLFYIENTEFGGQVENKKVDTSKNTITFMGKTFRGMLEKEYVQPPNGSAYLILNGEANEILNELISNRFGDLYEVENIGQSGIEVNYSVRDMNLLDAIEKSLWKSNARLEILFNNGKVRLQAKPIQDLSEIIQYDNSYGLSMIAETPKKAYNHILALGKGELTERLRVNLYKKKDGSWTTSSNTYFKGLERKTYKYEDVNCDDTTELINQAIDKVNELNGTEKLDISFTSDNAELFDIVGAKEEITGISFKQQITQKILKGSIYGDFENTKISYKVGG